MTIPPEAAVALTLDEMNNLGLGILDQVHSEYIENKKAARVGMSRRLGCQRSSGPSMPAGPSPAYRSHQRGGRSRWLTGWSTCSEVSSREVALPRTAYIAPRPCFQSPAGPRALRGARIVLLLRRSRRGPRSEHLARPAGPTRPSVSAASLYGLPLRLPFAVLRQARRDRTGTIGPQVLASLPVCSPIERIRPASSPEGGGTPRSTEAQGHHWRPHAAHPNPGMPRTRFARR